MSFADLLAADARLIQSHLNAVLQDRADQPVIHAMRYALQGGKRLRGFLVLESARMLGVPPTQALPARSGGRGVARLFPDPR